MSMTKNKRIHPRYRIPQKDNSRYEYEVVGTETIIHPHSILDQKKIMDFDFSGFIKNVSAEGLCFSSDLTAVEGEILDMDIKLPGTQKLIHMQGEVEWSQPVEQVDPKLINSIEEARCRTGLKILQVEGQSVSESIHYEKKYHLQWSILLESIFGTFRLIYRKDEK